MAGRIFTNLDNLCNVDSANVHPLVCHLCHEQYQSPCLLDCYHIFCARCLRGRTNDSRLSCPLCGYPSILKGNSSLPPEDRLLKFLVDNNADAEETVQCANCDQESSKKDAGGMYYCNTCSQPLCSACRELTHKARMFSHHEIVSLAKRSRAKHRKCPLHEEPYILFSTENKSMLCIKCFRDMQVESRTHCIDIETAYMQGCEMLDQAVLVVKELQTSAREAILLLRAMIGEVCLNVEEEESAICTLFNSLQEKLAERKKILLKAAQSQHEEKEKALKEQLSHLTALLPTLQVHLVTCSAFLSSANKFEFLDMGYQLMERLKRIVKLPHRLRPVQSSKINTDYRSEFARCLEPLLLLGQRCLPSVAGSISVAARHQSPLSMACRSPSLSEMPLGSVCGRRPSCHRNICTKVLLAEGRETPFTEHCRNYENTYRTLQTEIQSLKDQVQELHRDLTKHHSIINTDKMGEIMDRSLHIDSQIASQHSTVETMRVMFEEIWDETFQRVTNEQEIYEGFSPASRPNAAEAGELLPDHHHQTDQPLHPVHRQSQRETGAQVSGGEKAPRRPHGDDAESLRRKRDGERESRRVPTVLNRSSSVCDGLPIKVHDIQRLIASTCSFLSLFDNQTCVLDSDRHKNNRPLILESGDSSVKTSRPVRPRVTTETSGHNETPS
ncbi:RING finger protein 207 isoform X2 [Cyclopterus lumpus]|uniref:RING finger protein 207 isoform X2 n=1 Tax=Cyclopterus lumpus TaxID=8103 RepID=UPI0014864915|nr:RING finger protein 207 isoform X2 [Cyclopterus lumpus]XP_034389460.1 RING finger protein 207 isoform X2 [Cyclopterus lumpus]XP_034389461.1 RING finger protein 207 isoform X2 [Cyclopterus lumpus]